MNLENRVARLLFICWAARGLNRSTRRCVLKSANQEHRFATAGGHMDIERRAGRIAAPPSSREILAAPS
jgi:hypothetical protein